MLGGDGVAHLDHEGEHVVGRAAGVGLDEVGVLGRDLGRAVSTPLAPGGVDEAAGAVAGRVGEHRPGVLRRRAGWPGATARSRSQGLGPFGVARVAARAWRGSTSWWAAIAEWRYPRSRSAAGTSPSFPVRRSRTRTPTRLAAMSEPCPPAFMRTAPPIDPGTPTAHSNPVRPALAVRRATTGSRAAAPARTGGPVDLDRAERRAEVDGEPGESCVGHQQVRPVADDEQSMPVSPPSPGRGGPGQRRSSTSRDSAAGPPTR